MEYRSCEIRGRSHEDCYEERKCQTNPSNSILILKIWLVYDQEIKLCNAFIKKMHAKVRRSTLGISINDKFDSYITQLEPTIKAIPIGIYVN